MKYPVLLGNENSHFVERYFFVDNLCNYVTTHNYQKHMV